MSIGQHSSLAPANEVFDAFWHWHWKWLARSCWNTFRVPLAEQLNRLGSFSDEEFCGIIWYKLYSSVHQWSMPNLLKPHAWWPGINRQNHHWKTSASLQMVLFTGMDMEQWTWYAWWRLWLWWWWWWWWRWWWWWWWFMMIMYTLHSQWSGTSLNMIIIHFEVWEDPFAFPALQAPVDTLGMLALYCHGRARGSWGKPPRLTWGSHIPLEKNPWVV